MRSEAATRSDFSHIPYAQCWEDADTLLAGLDIQPGDVCLSIASAGDNALSMLTQNPARVIAIDLNPSQLACLELRIAAYRNLEHDELLQLIGSRDATPEVRKKLYQKCRDDLPDDIITFWDDKPDAITNGIGGAGKFESYFKLFRTRLLPLVHSERTINQLLAGGGHATREKFYESKWNTWRWRLLFNLFFSRRVMGLLGRSPAFFKYVEGSVADRILARTRHALVELNPPDNPYLHWILTGTHAHKNTSLPHALRPENFDPIRNNLNRLELRLASTEDILDDKSIPPINRFNLSDIFEYMSEKNYEKLLCGLAARAAPAARLAYWNMLAPRTRPASLAHTLKPHDALAAKLHAQDKAFFYSRFVVEEVLSP